MNLKEAKEFLKGLNKVSEYKGTPFAISVVKNFKAIKEKITILNELLNREVPEYDLVVKETNSFKKRYSKADDSIKEQLEVEYNDYVAEVEDIINLRKKKELEYLEKEINVTLTYVDETLIPENLSAKEIEAISPMIKFS